MRHFFTARLITLARVYFTVLFGWAIVHAFVLDRWWWMFLLTAFVEWFFMLLPLWLLVAWFTRRRELWLGVSLGLALGAWLYGDLWLPKPPLANANSNETLTVMTYNMYGFSTEPANVVAAIRAAQADVIAIQELNGPTAEALQRELSGDYPYQQLNPRPDVTGMGIISRYPLRETTERLAGIWVGPPQVVSVDFQGRPVWLLNLHPYSSGVGGGLPTTINSLHWSVQMREEDAQIVLALAAAHPEPLIVAADLNSTDRSSVYALMTSTLTDAWRERGWGWGRTLGGDFKRLPFPLWLIRIDYIFHSAHWRTESVTLGAWDDSSDHRPVIARLVWAQD